MSERKETKVKSIHRNSRWHRNMHQREMVREIAGTLADMLLAIHGLGNRAGFGMRVSKRDLNTCRWLMKGSRELLESYESLKNSDEFYKGTKFE